MSEDNKPSNAPLQVRYVDLTLDRLDHTDSIMLMGALCARVLRERGQITLYMGKENTVQQAMPYEVELDLDKEKDALQVLTMCGYTDEQLIDYLKGRDAREQARKRVTNAKDM